MISRNVADSVDIPGIRHNEMQTWDEADVTHFLQAAKISRYYALVYTALFTGMRRSELLALRWQDIDFLFGQVFVNRNLHHLKDGSYVFIQPKSARSRRTIALSPATSLLLKEHKERQSLERAKLGITQKDDDLVISDVQGKPLRPNIVTLAWSNLIARCGLKPIHLHDSRHTHASIMLKQSAHPKIVQERLGHSSISITLDTYSHVAPGLQEAATAGFDKLVLSKSKNEAILLEDY